MQRPSIAGNPLRWKGRGVAGADVPFVRVKRERPRTPRLRRFVNRESAMKAHVDFSSGIAQLRVGLGVNEQEAIQTGAVSETGPRSVAGILQRSRSFGE